MMTQDEAFEGTVIQRNDGKQLSLYGTDYKVSTGRILHGFDNVPAMVMFQAMNESGTMSVGEVPLDEVHAA